MPNQQLPGVLTLLRDAWSLYMHKLGIFVGIMVLPALVTLLFGIFTGGALISFGAFVEGGWFAPLIAAGVAVFLILLIAQTWAQAALLYAIKDSNDGAGIVEAYGRAVRKLPSYWWISILVGLITMGGFLLFIIPGILFAVWFSLALFILIAEDVRGMDALLKSREYVRGMWWPVAWRFIFISILSIIVYLVLGFAFSFLGDPLGSEAANLVAGLLWTPLLITYTFSVYTHLKALKGELVFSPTKKQKTGFIIVGIIGLLFIPAIVLLSLAAI